MGPGLSQWIMVQEEGLLGPNDPSPVEWVNPEGRSPIVLCCEHAGRAVPERLGDLGIDAAEMDRHIAYDVGAAGLARRLSARLDAALILQRFSRLVIDCNRPAHAPGCIPEASDGTELPMNKGIAVAERNMRWREIHQPFHDALASFLDGRAKTGTPTALVTVHSFTPVMRATGERRSVRLGLLFNRDPRLAEALMAAFTRAHPAIETALNVPYTVCDDSDYAIPVHGERRGIPHVLVEVRSDGIATEAGQEAWAAMLAPALTLALQTLNRDPRP